MTLLRLTLLIVVPSLWLLPLAARAAPAEVRSARSNSAAEAATAYPWKFDREHRFLWLHKNEKVGETRFLVKTVPFPGRPGERLVEVRATRSYHREAVVQQATGTTHVSFAGRPERYEEKLTVLHASTAKRSTQETDFERQGQTVRVAFVQNGRNERASVDERELEEGTFLCAMQAVEHWAIFVATLPKDFTTQAVKLYYPEHRKVFSVQLKKEGEETLYVGKNKVPSRRYTFRSGAGELDGRIWIGDDGRLLQVSFPQTQIRVVLASE